MKTWDIYSRQCLDAASSIASFGFGVAKTGTRFGFTATRGIAAVTVGVTTTILDHTVFGGSTVTNPIVGGAVASAISFAEQVALAPIRLSEYITSTSLIAAHGSINILSVIFPGSSEASFSIASFINLIKREWNDPPEGENLPKMQFGITQVARAIVAWISLQGVTQEWQEKKWFRHLREIRVREPQRTVESIRARRGSRIRVTSDVFLSNNRGQLISADIGEPPTRSRSVFLSPYPKSTMTPKTPTTPCVQRMSNTELKATLRRLSKMVLAGYGGASLLFFGVPLSSSSAPPPKGSAQAKAEEKELEKAIEASELEASGDASPGIKLPTPYSWWDVLLGRHDHEIFESFASTPPTIGKTSNRKPDLRVGSEHLMPRFWVLTDHGRRQVVLVLRGTMSINEIAVDLTCDLEEFEPAVTTPDDEDEDGYTHVRTSRIPGMLHFPTASSYSSTSTSPKYTVHGGMLRMAKAMGNIGRPVQLAVQEALYCNSDYDLVLCGHSLGAGVAGILGLMWADPNTCLTVNSSGLPTGRKVSVYCFAPPCLVSSQLSALSSSLIVSFVYSHDIVSRLSLGSIRDLKNASVWLCDEESRKGNGFNNVTRRASEWKKGHGRPGDEEWFIAVRKTLEANMHSANLFPPGRVLWALRDSDLHPSHRSSQATDADPSKLRLFDVLDVEAVFGQIYFARDMLGSHMPHNYDSVLHDLL